MQRMVDGELVDMTDVEIAALATEQTAEANAAAWGLRQNEARQALTDSDVTVLRCYENAIATPATWVTYRKDLRAIVSATTGDASLALPAMPAYPTGT